jgi:SAM-dependent methyltransferase
MKKCAKVTKRCKFFENFMKNLVNITKMCIIKGKPTKFAKTLDSRRRLCYTVFSAKPRRDSLSRKWCLLGGICFMLERMDDFFTERAEIYDGHMMNGCEGCREGYIEMARLLPPTARNILDVGCGTGLELSEIFRRFPNVNVTGIDFTQAMLDKLKEKYGDKNIKLIHASYIGYDFGTQKFDAAISFETMHHLTRRQKSGVYSNIHRALKPGGMYIECDYMVIDEKEERFYFEENLRIRKEQGIGGQELYHYDTPFTVDNQLRLLSDAGFRQAKQVWRLGGTTIVKAV